MCTWDKSMFNKKCQGPTVFWKTSTFQARQVLLLLEKGETFDIDLRPMCKRIDLKTTLYKIWGERSKEDYICD